MLVQIAHPDIFRPLYFAFIRHQLPGDDIHEGGFSLAVGTDETDMFSLQQTEGYVMENGSVSKAVGQMFYIQYAHSILLVGHFSHIGIDTFRSNVDNHRYYLK